MPDKKVSEFCPCGDARILVFGGRGMLGSEVVEGLKAVGCEVSAPVRPDVDITDPLSLGSLFVKESAPRLVINCAAYTAVDKAESEPEVSFAVNRDGAANLAGACREIGIPLIHVSTDYVFDGKSRRAYKEDDPAAPLNVYARSKWEGEQAVRSRLGEHIIVRTSWLYGVRGANFVKTILRLGREREQLGIIDDQHGSPTWTRDLAGCIMKSAGRICTGGDKVRWGTYHFCNNGITTWYGFASAIIDEARKRESLKVCEIKPIPTSAYPLPAERPAWSVLDCLKIEEEFGISRPAWEKSLVLMLEELWKVEAPASKPSGQP